MRQQVIHHTFRTTDPDIAEQAFRVAYSRARMSPVVPDAPFLFEQEIRGGPGFTIARTVFDGRMTGDNVLGDYVTVARTLSGRLDWDIRDTRGTAEDLVLIQRGDLLTAGWGPVDAVMLNLERSALARTAALFYGEGVARVRFDSPHPVSAQLARHYAGVLDHAREVVESEAFESPLVRASLYRSLAAAVLEGFQLEGDRMARAFSAAALSAVHRRARAFMDDYASLPITIEDAAQAVGVPATEIRRAFAAFSALRPSEYLRSVRLSAAHEDLRRGDPSRGDTVREIAHRWGFASPGRFASHYRAAYGVSPKEVLDR